MACTTCAGARMVTAWVSAPSGVRLLSSTAVNVKVTDLLAITGGAVNVAVLEAEGELSPVGVLGVSTIVGSLEVHVQLVMLVSALVQLPDNVTLLLLMTV